MRAEIKQFFSPDIHDLASYKPQDPESFSFLLRVIAGPEGEMGEESFDIEVCTPKWLLETYQRDDIIIGRHYLIVFEYSFERIIQTIREYFTFCTGETWQQVAEKLSRFGKWEFEDYKDDGDDSNNLI